MDIGHTLKSITMGMPTIFTGGQPPVRAGNERLAWASPNLAASQEVFVRSDAFENVGQIPAKFSVDGQDISPPLSWSRVPDGTQSLTLLVEDPDAPTPNPFVHWILYNLPPDLCGLPEDVRHENPAAAGGGALQGKNSNLKIGWTGMAPPKGDTPHHYHFQLFALDKRLDLEPGAGRSAVIDAMAGHVIGRGEVVGTYQR
jgi:Raf kinase inhibitor-like YbhB/YbcL family protein